MKRSKLIIVVNVITFYVLVACTDFLEEKSQDEIIPSSVTDFRELLYFYEQTSFSPAIFLMDDDIAIDESQYYGDEEFFKAVDIEGFFTWQPDMWEKNTSVMSSISDNYFEMYENIKAINAVLEKIDDAEGSGQERDIVKAQALSLRAYFYFMLVNIFGEPYNYNREALGIVLKLESLYMDDKLTRSTVEEVYNQIIDDFELASKILNKYPKQRGDYLINNTTVDILLSRVYLYMEKWDKVIEAANRAIESAEGLFDYTMLPVGSRFYMTTYENSEVEWIFSYTTIPTSIVTVANDLMVMYDIKDRRAEFLPGDYFGIGKTDVKGNGPRLMIRSAEAYLNRAEAKVLLSTPDLTGALTDLNELRKHRIMDYVDVSITNAEMLLEEIRDERRKELCFEGHRWFDLRRYGMPSISHDFRTSLAKPLLRYTLREKDPLYTLPIPRDILENNTKLQQNSSALEPDRAGLPIN